MTEIMLVLVLLVVIGVPVLLILGAMRLTRRRPNADAMQRMAREDRERRDRERRERG